MLRGMFGISERRACRVLDQSRSTHRRGADQSGVGAWTTRWTYDAADRMSTMTNPDGEVVTATYDAAGQALGLESAWPAGGAGTTRTLAANATYNGLGQRSSVGYGNGTTQHWRHYGQETQNWGQQHYGRLRQTCVITTAATCPDDDRDGAATKLSLHYWYDAAGNVRYVDDRSRRWKTAGVWAGPTPTRDAYAYDALDRLTAWCVNPSVWANCGGAIAGDETYAYDAIGNLTNKDGVGYGYAASGAGSVRPHAVVSTTAGGQFSYDANGNMTSRRITATAAVQTLAWTAENRLQRVTVGGATKADFDYDADGVRVRSLANGETTIYAAGGYEVVVAGVTALTRTQYYEFGGQRTAMRVWRPGTTATVTTWLHGDALGSARAATTLSGAVAAGSLTRYTPYGQTASGGGGPSDHTFTGQRSFVDAVGLMDYGARFYDPALGRFVSADSIVPEPGNPQALNRYAYVLNAPTRYTDPSGHRACANQDDCYESGETPNGQGQSRVVVPTSQQAIASVPAAVPTPAPIVTPQPFSTIIVPPPDGDGPNYQPPQGTGLPDKDWEWGNNWPGLGRGWKNSSDEEGAVWRPDIPKTKPSATEGEDPHWHRRLPGAKGRGTLYPPNPEWGRGSNDRKRPGIYNRQTGIYDPLNVASAETTEDVGVAVGVTGATTGSIWLLSKLLSPICGPAAIACAILL